MKCSNPALCQATIDVAFPAHGHHQQRWLKGCLGDPSDGGDTIGFTAPRCQDIHSIAEHTERFSFRLCVHAGTPPHLAARRSLAHKLNAQPTLLGTYDRVTAKSTNLRVGHAVKLLKNPE